LSQARISSDIQFQLFPIPFGIYDEVSKAKFEGIVDWRFPCFVNWKTLRKYLSALPNTRVGTLIVATIYLQLIRN